MLLWVKEVSQINRHKLTHKEVAVQRIVQVVEVVGLPFNSHQEVQTLLLQVEVVAVDYCMRTIMEQVVQPILVEVHRIHSLLLFVMEELKRLVEQQVVMAMFLVTQEHLNLEVQEQVQEEVVVVDIMVVVEWEMEIKDGTLEQEDLH
jgi:hypothetical protein